MISSVLLLCAGLTTSLASAACSRELLQGATAAYLEAQAAGQPNITALASNLSYAENDTPMDISKGVLAQPITIDFNRSIYDTTECASFTELNAATSSHPYVIHTRMLLTGDKITTIESVVTDTGDWSFNATSHLYWTEQENWDPIPKDKRDSRDVIKAAADAYLNQWGNTSIPVPLGTPCARLEGGGYTGEANLTANTCEMGAFPEPIQVGNRRYVIDEELGAVDVFDGFPWLDSGKTDGDAPSSNMIRVQGGMIRYIHELTVCSIPQCGR